MKRLVQILPIILAAALQIMPMLRNLFINPATGNTIAFILRWGVGSAATVGAYDACSGSSIVVFNSPTNFTGTIGTYFTNNISVTNNGGDAGAYFILSNALGISSVLVNGNTTTTCMPPGLTFKCYDLNTGGSSKPIYGAIYGTNTTGETNFPIQISVGHPAYGSGVITTQISIWILPSGSGGPPVITNGPVSLTNNVSSNVTFSVTAGTAPLHYQWYFNTNTVEVNATNSSLTLTNIQLTNAGTYSVIITNSSGSVTSSFARLTVWQSPVITNQPVSLTNNVSSNATFAVIAGGVPGIAYQWYFNTNTALFNATNTSLTLTNIQLTNAGMYSVIITNSAGSVTSSFAQLTVWQPPVITNQPASLTNNVSSNATFAVTAGGVPGIAYQWYFNTNTTLLNATNTSLTLTNIQLTNAGNYRVIITNSAGSVTSSFAQLTVWQPPNITSQPVGITTLAGSSPTFSVTAGGVPAVSYQWNLNTNTVLTGATGTSLNLANIRASQSGNFYSVVITNNAGSVTSSVAKLVVTNPLPSNLTFSAPAATGSAFQFSFTPVVGLTNTVLTNGVITGGTWNVFTNIPPPATATPITISNVSGNANLFFRIMVLP